MDRDARIRKVVEDRRVRVRLFAPSHRKVWTVVGKTGEYWVDPDRGYCSCPGYYFGEGECYHLDAARRARDSDEVEISRAGDDEFGDFLKGLFHDVWCNADMEE